MSFNNKGSLSLTMASLIIIFGFLISLLILFIGSQEIEDSKVPCVDGYNRVNLEGLMCAEKNYEFFGLPESYSLLSNIPLVLAFILVLYLKRKEFFPRRF